MKYILTYLLAFLCYVASSVSCIWAIVEFILHLVKDKVFNWWSVWCIPIFLVIAIILSIVAFVFKTKERTKPELGKPLKKSKWQTRMEEIQKQREGFKRNT